MYENTTYEIILQRMLERIPDKLDKREGSVIFDTLSPTSIEFQILYLELENILKEAYGDTASREFLILRCAERGIFPKKATNTLLKGVFTPPTLDISVGTQFNIDDLNYEVTGKIAAGEYSVECKTAGVVGNQYLGTMVPMEYVRGLKTAELTQVLIPGEDEEETEALRKRYFDSFDLQAFGGNRQDYIEKTNKIPGVGSVKVTPVWNADISPSSMIPSAAVTAWYNSVVGGLGEEAAAWLSNVYMAAHEKKLTTGGTVKLTILDSDYNAASDALIDRVQTEIDPQDVAGEGLGLSPIGHVVSVKSADTVPITVHTILTFESGFGWFNLQSAIDTAVGDYLLELRRDWADSLALVVRISQIETRLLSITGILDISGTKINGEESNLNLGGFEIPVLGGVTNGQGG